MVNQAHMRWDNLPIRGDIARMRHDGCDGGAGRVEHRGRERRPSRCAVYAKPPRKAPKKAPPARVTIPAVVTATQVRTLET
jgi:hypothetical protein